MYINREVDTIVFDLGKVLIDWDPKYLFRKIFEHEDQMDFFLENVCTPNWNAEQDAGRPWTEAVQMLSREYPKYQTEIQAYWERWPEMLNGPIAGSVELLQQIAEQGRHRLLALTNWSDETWPFAWDRFEFLRIFEGIVVSGKENVKKPDPKIYRILIDRYGIKPERSLFIDDSLNNVISARKEGFLAIHFTSPEQLEKELTAAEIIQKKHEY